MSDNEEIEWWDYDDAEEMADAIVTALAMPREERVRRWRALVNGVRREDVFWWCRLFLDALEEVEEPVTA